MSVTKKHRVPWVVTAFLLSVLGNTALASVNTGPDMLQGAELSHSAQVPCESESDHPVEAQHFTDTDNHGCTSNICQCATQGCHLTLIAFNSSPVWSSRPHHPAFIPLRQNLPDAGPKRLDRPPRS